MRNYSRKHLSDSALTHQLDLNTAATNEKIAEQIADFAEFDDRKLFRDSGYQSMSQYCRFPSRIDAPAPAFELPTAEGKQESPPELSARRVAPAAKMTPLAPERFGLQCTIDKETHDLLLQAQALIGEAAPAAQVPNVVKRSLKLLVESTVANIRLRCPAHNQLEAERVFGSEFMKDKREAGRAKKPVSPEPQLGPAAAEVVPWLRGLGFRIAEANAAAAICEDMESEPIEKRVRVALSYFKRSSPLAAAGMA